MVLVRVLLGLYSMTEAQADMFFSVTSGVGLSLLRMRITPSGGTSETSIAKQAVARGPEYGQLLGVLLQLGKVMAVLITGAIYVTGLFVLQVGIKLMRINWQILPSP